MAYLAELDVNDYGCLVGSVPFPIDVIDHDWRTPYPTTSAIAQLTWEMGELKKRPDVYWAPETRDWVCNGRAFETLSALFPADIHVVGHARDGHHMLHVIQIVGMLDVVDMEASIVDRYPAYEILRFPAFRRSESEAISRRLFRVPQAMVDVFAGAAAKDAIDNADIKGLRFVSTDWSES
ncbi:MAG TPA: hypothetical protein VGE93_21405 [Bryobacteraceae bacterium]